MPITDISDLIENDLVEKEVLTDLGVTRMNASSQNGIYENVFIADEDESQCFLYRWEFHSNFRTGFWEVDVFTTSSLKIGIHRTIIKQKKI